MLARLARLCALFAVSACSGEPSLTGAIEGDRPLHPSEECVVSFLHDRIGMHSKALEDCETMTADQDGNWRFAKSARVFREVLPRSTRLNSSGQYVSWGMVIGYSLEFIACPASAAVYQAAHRQCSHWLR